MRQRFGGRPSHVYGIGHGGSASAQQPSGWSPGSARCGNSAARGEPKLRESVRPCAMTVKFSPNSSSLHRHPLYPGTRFKHSITLRSIQGSGRCICANLGQQCSSISHTPDIDVHNPDIPRLPRVASLHLHALLRKAYVTQCCSDTRSMLASSAPVS